MPTDVLIVNIAVLFAVLEADLGRRKITRFRILRPLLLAAGIIPLFIAHPAAAGNGEILEIALAGGASVAYMTATTASAQPRAHRASVTPLRISLPERIMPLHAQGGGAKLVGQRTVAADLHLRRRLATGAEEGQFARIAREHQTRSGAGHFVGTP
jgi:hypothetical protein